MEVLVVRWRPTENVYLMILKTWKIDGVSWQVWDVICIGSMILCSLMFESYLHDNSGVRCDFKYFLLRLFWDGITDTNQVVRNIWMFGSGLLLWLILCLPEAEFLCKTVSIYMHFISWLTSLVQLQAAFRALVGKGYQTLQSLLLDFCQRRPSEGLLNALLDMLVDGKFDIKGNPLIQVTASFGGIFYLLGLIYWWTNCVN